MRLWIVEIHAIMDCLSVSSDQQNVVLASEEGGVLAVKRHSYSCVTNTLNSLLHMSQVGPELFTAHITGRT